MRDKIFEEIHKRLENRRTYIITSDLGVYQARKIKQQFPNNVWN